MFLEKLNVSYPGRQVFTDFTAEFPDGETTLILGASGCGKTTLLHALAEQVKNNRAVSFVFQEPRLIPWVSVRTNLVLALSSSGFTGNKLTARIDHYLNLVSLHSRADDRPDKLSGGERQRAAIARAFANPAPVLLMDEPFQSQDPATKRQLIALVRQLQELERRTIIAVTHNLDETELYGDHLLLLEGRPAKISFQANNTPESRSRLAERFIKSN